jgi:hypothetical protein
MKSLFNLGVLALALLSARALEAVDTPVDAAFWNSSRSTNSGDGIQATKDWSGVGNDGFKLSWDISLDNNIFHYVYTVTDTKGGDLDKDLSHLILQFSDSFTSSDYLDANGNPVPGIVLTNYSSTTQGGSNPNMPGVLYGVKYAGDGGQLTIDFYTQRAPVWGSFYAKSGKTDGVDVVAWNTGFTSTSTGPGVGVTDFTPWIARPDSSLAIPEPTTMLLMGSSLGAIYFARRKKANS